MAWLLLRWESNSRSWGARLVRIILRILCSRISEMVVRLCPVCIMSSPRDLRSVSKVWVVIEELEES